MQNIIRIISIIILSLVSLLYLLPTIATYIVPTFVGSFLRLTEHSDIKNKSGKSIQIASGPSGLIGHAHQPTSIIIKSNGESQNVYEYLSSLTFTDDEYCFVLSKDTGHSHKAVDSVYKYTTDKKFYYLSDNKKNWIECYKNIFGTYLTQDMYHQHTLYVIDN